MYVLKTYDIHHCVANFMMSYILFFNYVSVENIYKINHFPSC